MLKLISIFLYIYITQEGPGFDSRAVHVGFVVDKVALR